MSETPFDVPRWGVFRANGEFCELKLDDWESDPDAGKARWVGGDKDAELVRSVTAAIQAELTAAMEKIAEQEATIKALREDAERLQSAARRLGVMLPLFEEARDAISTIPLATAKLHNLRLDLADRMDEVGVADRWETIDASRKK